MAGSERFSLRTCRVISILSASLQGMIAQRHVREENRSRDRRRPIASVLTNARDLLSRTVRTGDILRRTIFLSLSIARTASIFSILCPDVPVGRENAVRFHPAVFAVCSLMVSAIRSKTRPWGSSYLRCSCNDSFYSRMHAAYARARACTALINPSTKHH